MRFAIFAVSLVRIGGRFRGFGERIRRQAGGEVFRALNFVFIA